MHRFTAPALAAIFLTVQICCAPPLAAAASDAVEPMTCPIQKKSCDAPETRSCEGGPRLIADAPPNQFFMPAPPQGSVIAVRAPSPHPETFIIPGWWSTPTRTIQLRI